MQSRYVRRHHQALLQVSSVPISAMIKAKTGYIVVLHPRRKKPSLLRSDVELVALAESWLIYRGVGRPEFLDSGLFCVN